MGSSVRTVGVEEELMLFTIDGAPALVGEQLADDPSTAVEHEFKLEQAEIATAPTDDLAGLADDLRRRRAEIIAAAAERHVLVAALATSPARAFPTATPGERYRRMHERYAFVAAEQLTCGAHVHVSIDSRAEGVAAIDGVRRWTAVLLALSANSPFWAGADTGYGSFRSIAWGRWPSAGPTSAFADEDEYDRRVGELLTTGAAMDSGMVYFDVRLSAKYPTVEFRVADVGQEVTDSVLLAALCRAAVTTALARPFREPGVSLLRAAAWRAARFGMGGDLVDIDTGNLRPAAQVVATMVEELTPALRESGDADVVRDCLERLSSRGTGADLQRADFARRGARADVVRAAADRTAGG